MSKVIVTKTRFDTELQEQGMMRVMIRQYEYVNHNLVFVSREHLIKIKDSNQDVIPWWQRNTEKTRQSTKKK